MGDAVLRTIRRYTQLYGQTTRNPNYPEENYEMFVVRAIARKKRRIEIELDIEDIPPLDDL